MGDKSAIEWTDATWNPIRGCSRVSEGCRNCYAERVAARFSGPGMPYERLANMTPSGPRWTGQVQLVEEHLYDPAKWRRPRRIFVNSMSDLFHEKLTDQQIDRIFSVMAFCGRHTFQILTKRPGRMLEYVAAMAALPDRARAVRLAGALGWPLSNVWLGVSAEDQDAADRRIPLLVRTPAARRFISAEPLLGPIDFKPWIGLCDSTLIHTDGAYDEAKHEAANARGEFMRPSAWALHWIIVGGESGPGARGMDPEWARSIRDQSVAAGVPFFFKQWGEYVVDSQAPEKTGLEVDRARARFGIELRPGVPRWFKLGKKRAGRDLDGRTWNEMPRWGGA